VEFTCLWFQKHLSKFLQSDKTVFLVTGQPGAGKTTLAGSIVERLQRPVNRKQIDTVFCSLSPDIPTTATSLAVVKSLLFQLLNIRIGNMSMYHALLGAYHQCRTSADLGTYEENLWSALADTLKHPVEGGNDLIMVVDGLDEIAESQSASIQAAGSINPSALLDKLTRITNDGRGVRLITLSSSAKMPSHAFGLQHQITKDNVRDDLHAVALRALVHNIHFHSKPAGEQETLLDRIIHASNGSFLWTILVCEYLNSQKSADAITKTLTGFESSKPSVQDLVLKLFTSLDTTSNAKTVLSWIMAAERPLTVEEIHTLFNIDSARGTLSDKGVNVHATIEALKPLLTLHDSIIRFKHPIVHTALHDLAQQKKIPINLQESETDLLLRVLTYAKLTLRDKGEPSLGNHDPNISDSLFSQHHFLEYTVRYWVLHLQQSPTAPKPSGEFKPTTDLQKALPDTTVLPILEQLVWGTQLPLPEAIELHKLVATVRRTVFTDEHPSVLQSYLAVATSYMLIDNPTEAQKYFYLCTKISRKILSDYHPLTLECANTYLKITESMTTNTRNEVTTRREEILIVLITAYERQYGSTSELVIETRKLLVELYASINEEERALEVYRLIQNATVEQYGRNSHQVQDAHGHLNVVLGKGKSERILDGYKESFFHDEDNEEEAVEVFDLDSIETYLRKADRYISQKEVALAEKTFVEVWQEVSTKCRSSQSIEWHEKNIEVATAYSQFLRAEKRTTEASAVLTCVWQQYEHRHLSFSEKIVSRLISVAKEFKTIGSYSQALSIFRHANSYYKNVRKEENSTSREVSKEVCFPDLLQSSFTSFNTLFNPTSISVVNFCSIFVVFYQREC
jgi:tetratricopeptide (TPR) repeat protein